MTLTTINLAALGDTINLSTEVTGTLPTGNGGTGSTATTFVNAATNVTGTLATTNGGTGATSFAPGKIGKISMQTGSPNQVDIASASFVQLTDGGTPLVASITPSASSSNVLMQVCIQAKTDDSKGYSVSLRRAGAQFYASADAIDVQYDGGGNHNIGRYSWFTYDTGISTTSATEYSVYVKTARVEILFVFKMEVINHKLFYGRY